MWCGQRFPCAWHLVSKHLHEADILWLSTSLYLASFGQHLPVSAILCGQALPYVRYLMTKLLLMSGTLWLIHLVSGNLWPNISLWLTPYGYTAPYVWHLVMKTSLYDILLSKSSLCLTSCCQTPLYVWHCVANISACVLTACGQTPTGVWHFLAIYLSWHRPVLHLPVSDFLCSNISCIIHPLPMHFLESDILWPNILLSLTSFDVKLPCVWPLLAMHLVSGIILVKHHLIWHHEAKYPTVCHLLVKHAPVSNIYWLYTFLCVILCQTSPCILNLTKKHLPVSTIFRPNASWHLKSTGQTPACGETLLIYQNHCTPHHE